MEKTEIIEIPDFEYSPKGFKELKTMLKAGKIVRNPFAKYYENIEVDIENTDNRLQVAVHNAQ